MVDDYSRKLWIFILKTKDEVNDFFKNWKTLIENQTGKKIKRFRKIMDLNFVQIFLVTIIGRLE